MDKKLAETVGGQRIAFTFTISLALAAVNWLLLLPALGIVAALYMQVGNEEAMVSDRFGQEYREYLRRTPRFLPKFRHEHPRLRK